MLVTSSFPHVIGRLATTRTPRISAAKEKVATDLAEMERKLEMQSQAAEAAAKQHAAEMPAMDNKTSSDLVRDLTKHLREVSARAKALASNLSNLTNHNASVVASILASNSALAGAAAAAVKAASLAARNQTELSVVF